MRAWCNRCTETHHTTPSAATIMWAGRRENWEQRQTGCAKGSPIPHAKVQTLAAASTGIETGKSLQNPGRRLGVQGCGFEASNPHCACIVSTCTHGAEPGNAGTVVCRGPQWLLPVARSRTSTDLAAARDLGTWPAKLPDPQRLPPRPGINARQPAGGSGAYGTPLAPSATLCSPRSSLCRSFAA